MSISKILERLKSSNNSDRDERQCGAEQYLSSIASLALIFASMSICIRAFNLEPTEKQCILSSFSWTPAFDQINYHWENFEGIDFFSRIPYFDYTQTDEVEKVWNDLLPDHPIAIPLSRLEELNQSYTGDSSWVHPPNDPDSVLALPEVFVQLGCVNFVRQWMFQSQREDYINLASFQGGETLVQDRAHQCLERLRQAVMCWSDTAVILQEFDDLHRLIYDFGTQHNCRNFDKIKLWTEENAVKNVKMDNLWWGGSEAV